MGGTCGTNRVGFAGVVLDAEKAYIAAEIIRDALKELPPKKEVEYEKAGIGSAV